jgi:hypothetical protein
MCAVGVALPDGLRTTTWVANRTLRRLPETAAAFGAGRISQVHVAALVVLHRGALTPLVEPGRVVPGRRRPDGTRLDE